MRYFIVLCLLFNAGCSAVGPVQNAWAAYEFSESTQPFDWRKSVSNGELRFEWPRGDLKDNGPNYMYAIGPEDQWRHRVRPQQRKK